MLHDLFCISMINSPTVPSSGPNLYRAFAVFIIVHEAHTTALGQNGHSQRQASYLDSNRCQLDNYAKVSMYRVFHCTMTDVLLPGITRTCVVKSGI